MPTTDRCGLTEVESQEGLKRHHSFVGCGAKLFISVGVLDVYLYLGKVSLGPLSGYLWLLGRRLYIKLGWRPCETYFLEIWGSPLHSGKAQAPRAETYSEEGRSSPR